MGNDPKALRDRVESLTDYEGITGTITMDPKTHMPTGLEMIMYTYDGSTPVKLDKYAAK
ncbi:hypothetical protein SDC9_170206 [bioreactor metagenome]|uniref:Leucine-binding protein domain-containing protein n=1 Tax=bioreactor metagenome TaxID=1076179 RepID=A0A645GA19_9ZZZZ